MLKLKHFTLIELLVIISIIGILISLLQPSLKSIMLTSQRLKCSENLRAIGASYHLYAEDNDDAVADCIFIGSIAQRTIWTNNTTGNYAAARSAGRFNSYGSRWSNQGYLEPYLGDVDEMYTCPGSEFAQGEKTFGTSPWARRTSTYTSFTPFNFMVRKRNQDHIINPNTDSSRGWDLKTRRPVYFDPVVSMYRWYKPGSGMRWDQVGSVIHGNQGELPILMSDGQVYMYDRIQYPTQHIDKTGYRSSGVMINQIMNDL
jgi:type II secretory pathway pseudopilin PulG